MPGPTDMPPGRPRVRRPAGLLGMLVLVALAEATLAGHRADLARPVAEDWRFAAWAAAREAPGRDVLCFGDSLVKYGVLPRVVQARAGLKAFNLATSGGTMPSSFFLLKRALDAGARPRAVVVDCAALMLRDSEPTTLHNYPELATAGDCLELACTAGDARFLAAALVAKLLPSYAWRFEARDFVRSSLAGQARATRAEGEAYRRRWTSALGAQPTPPGRTRHPSEDYLIDGVSPASWAIDPTDEAYLDRFLGLAGSRGIPVYWLIPPLAPEAHARRQLRGSDAAYDRLVRSRLGRFPGVVVLDARGSGYGDSVHVDHIHLDRVGAAVLSADLADVVAGRPGAAPVVGRWVHLPAVGGRAEVLAARPWGEVR